MADFRLRPARESDAPGIKALIRAVHINPLGLDWRRFIVAESQEMPILGCGQVKPHPGNLRELASIAVWPEYRGRGIARKIIEDLLSSEEGPLYLMCASPVCPLYEKFDFHFMNMHEMPPYFRRMIRLTDLMRTLAPDAPRIMVLKRDATREFRD